MNKRSLNAPLMAAILAVCLMLSMPCTALADESLAPYPHDDNLVDPLAPYGKRADDSTWSESDEADAMAALAESDKDEDADGKEGEDGEEQSEDEPEPVVAEWKRLRGDNALITMAEIVQEGFESSHTVVIAASNGYWDALSASSIAGVSGAPVLLTATDVLSPQAEEQVKRLKPQRAIICGGEDSVSIDVEERLKAIGVKTIERYSGDNAAETAAAIGKQVGMRTTRCVIATVKTYHDALSIAPYAYAYQAPIYLTNFDGVLSDDTVAAIKEVGYEHAIIVGGSASVKPEVEKQLEDAGIIGYGRFAGPNAYATSARIASWEIEEGLLSPTGIGVACGKGYWDALTGAALCGVNNWPLVLADDDNYSAAVCIINEYAGTIAKGYLFGGTDSIGLTSEQKILEGISDSAFESLKDVRGGGYTKIGIDISEWQREIDFERVKNSGVDYVIIRVGYGGNDEKYDDKMFLKNVKKALAAKMPIGVYLYSYAEDAKEADDEADHMLRLLKEAGLLPGSLAYGVWYDLEDSSMADEKNAKVLFEIAKTFNERMKKAGYTPGVYANLNWWNHYLTGGDYDQWERWVAQYNNECTYDGDYCMWQCKSTGVIDGIAGNVDMDLYYR